MFPTVEVRHLHAVIVLAEELNFTRASHRLNITQSTLSKQISELEERHRFQLFTRDNRRVVRVELTDAGRVFVEEARSLLLHIERAFHLARVAHDGADSVLAIGHSPDADKNRCDTILDINTQSTYQSGGRIETLCQVAAHTGQLLHNSHKVVEKPIPQWAQLRGVA